MGAIGVERGVEAGMMTGDTLDVIVMVKMDIEAPAATSTEAGLLVDHALSHQLTTDTTDQVQTDDLAVTMQNEKMTEFETGVIGQWSGDARQVRRSVPKARLQSHNLLKTNVIGGQSSSNNLPHGLELRS
jgi:hypothetical protein